MAPHTPGISGKFGGREWGQRQSLQGRASAPAGHTPAWRHVMSNRFRTMIIATAAVAMVVVATLSVRAARTSAQTAAAVRVETLPRGQQAIAPGQKGATYYWLESQTQKLTTRFAEGTATAGRDVHGQLNTQVRDCP